MVREKIKVEDFNRVAREHEYFLWNFVNLNSYHLQIQSIFTEENPYIPNAMRSILEMIPIPYFETELKDAFDFLIGLDTRFIHNVYKNNYFQPVLLSFNRWRMIDTTYYPNCYCSDGIIKLIDDLNPKFILDAKI